MTLIEAWRDDLHQVLGGEAYKGSRDHPKTERRCQTHRQTQKDRLGISEGENAGREGIS